MGSVLGGGRKSETFPYIEYMYNKYSIYVPFTGNIEFQLYKFMIQIINSIYIGKYIM